MTDNLAASITKAASSQTYYTIRFMVDRDRVTDAYRSYAYFRWVDDVLDSGSASEDGNASGRRRFLARQKKILESCYRGEPTDGLAPQETLLVDLIRGDGEENSSLKIYLRNMMAVMEFDTGRRGALVSQSELDEYTRRLAVAVTENIHHFIGHNDFVPRDETRYLAVTAAHIVHMLRDTHDDLRAGYYNIPREVLEAGRIGPRDVDSPAYRSWVKSRVQSARLYFEAGKEYFRRAGNRRHRLAGFAYIARFEWLLDTIEREGYRIRPEYQERKSLGTAWTMLRLALSTLPAPRVEEKIRRPIVSQREGKA